MSELRSYAAGLEREILPPDLAQLERVASRRGRQRATTLVAAALIAIAGAVVVGPDGADNDTLPAVGPTPTATGADAFRALTARQIAALSPMDAQTVVTANDDRRATVRVVHACLDEAGRLVGDGEALPGCRTAWEVTNARTRIWIPGMDIQSLRDGPATPQYLGDGIFLHALWGEERVRSFLIDTDTMTMTTLKEGMSASRPGPGRQLVHCGYSHAACVVDLPAGRLDLLEARALPAWIPAFGVGSWSPWVEPLKVGTEEFVVFPHGLTHERSPRQTPLLASDSMGQAIPLTQGQSVEPVAGMQWVKCAMNNVCVVDVSARTIHEVRLETGPDWAHNTVGGFWGLTFTTDDDDSTDARWTAVWVGTDGSQSTHVLATQSRDSYVTIADRGPTRALTYYEQTRNGSGFLHVSTDRGTSWRVLVVSSPVPQELVEGRLPTGWESWPEVA